jgi:hypothetical protein
VRNSFNTWMIAKNEALEKMVRDGISPNLV